MNPQKDPKKAPRPAKNYGVYVLFAIILFGSFVFLSQLFEAKGPEKLSPSQFQSMVVDGKLNDTTIKWTPVGGEDQNAYKVTVLEGSKVIYEFSILYPQLDEVLSNIPDASNITVQYVEKSTVTFWSILISVIIPIGLVLALLFFLFKSMSGGGANNKAFEFSKSRARLSNSKLVTFKDVAGCDEEKEELIEVIDFLKFPKKYKEMGARIPKGILLVGSPGTGKTLLAKAVAGEANVPFFSISGSDFVEMFVGVGASRVRDLFKVAKESSPCIIFIDEIDAVGRQRGAGMGGGHDEREQTLNQLLVEMDGFNPNLGIIIMAATNRPDVLDPALLRPGRFDRQITIDLPDVIGREAILKVHARNKKLSDQVKYNEVAQRIPGFSGADIENLLNEAALLAARANRKVIELQDIDEAVDRVMMGPAKRTRKVTDKERKIIAYHEAGHAVIGIKLENANVVQKVTIVARGNAGGYNLMMPEEETFLESKQSLLARITGYLGGRVAEELIFGDITTGAYGDFQTATKIARAMVTEYGMSNLGPIQYESHGGSVFLGRDYLKDKNFSDHIATEIDKEVRDIITGCYDKARALLLEHRDLLDTISHYLLEIETLNKQDIEEIVRTGKVAWWEEKKLAPKEPIETNPLDEKVEESPLDETR